MACRCGPGTVCRRSAAAGSTSAAGRASCPSATTVPTPPIARPSDLHVPRIKIISRPRSTFDTRPRCQCRSAADKWGLPRVAETATELLLEQCRPRSQFNRSSVGCSACHVRRGRPTTLSRGGAFGSPGRCRLLNAVRRPAKRHVGQVLHVAITIVGVEDGETVALVERAGIGVLLKDVQRHPVRAVPPDLIEQ